MGIVRRLIRAGVPVVGPAAIRALARTMKFETCGAEAAEARWRRGENAIFAFWHGHQLMMPVGPYGGRGMGVLISRHADGELIARTIRAFGFEAVRGSTSRGGARALREMIAMANRGADLAVTPDGPRGPRGIVKRGVIEMARQTGLPIFPVVFGASKKKL